MEPYYLQGEKDTECKILWSY